MFYGCGVSAEGMGPFPTDMPNLQKERTHEIQ